MKLRLKELSATNLYSFTELGGVFFFLLFFDSCLTTEHVNSGTLNKRKVHLNEPSHKKTEKLRFQLVLTQTRLYSHRSRLEASNFGCRKKRDSTICVAKTKMLISCAVTPQR